MAQFLMLPRSTPKKHLFGGQVKGKLAALSEAAMNKRVAKAEEMLQAAQQEE